MVQVPYADLAAVTGPRTSLRRLAMLVCLSDGCWPRAYQHHHSCAIMSTLSISQVATYGVYIYLTTIRKKKNPSRENLLLPAPPPLLDTACMSGWSKWFRSPEGKCHFAIPGLSPAARKYGVLRVRIRTSEQICVSAGGNFTVASPCLARVADAKPQHPPDGPIRSGDALLPAVADHCANYVRGQAADILARLYDSKR